MTYDEEFINQIVNSVDLLEYAKEKYEFEQRGDNWFTSCPLHVDNTPSLCINQKTNRYHCFSCDKGGGIISWLIHIEGLDSDSAIQKAASIASLEYTASQDADILKRLREYKKLSKPNSIVVNETLSEKELFGFTRAYPELWLNEGITKQAMDDLGGIFYDRFKRRIWYPVRDIDGNIINMKGRTILEDYKELGIQKYMNLRKIGVMDYFQGLSYTKEFVKKEREIILFESFKSVMKCWSWGIKNTAAMETNSLTPEQVKNLIGLGVDVTFAFDSDVKYEKVYNVAKMCSRYLNTYIMFNPDLLGGPEAKNSPADCGEEIMKKMYTERRRIF